MKVTSWAKVTSSSSQHTQCVWSSHILTQQDEDLFSFLRPQMTEDSQAHICKIRQDVPLLIHLVRKSRVNRREISNKEWNNTFNKNTTKTIRIQISILYTVTIVTRNGSMPDSLNKSHDFKSWCMRRNFGKQLQQNVRHRCFL